MDTKISIQGNLEINKEKGSVLVSVNPKIYPLDVVLSSAYVFTNDCYVLVDGDPVEEIIVELRPKDKNSDIESVGRNFNNELINYANYTVQAIKNEKLREAILNRVLLTNSGKNENIDTSSEQETSPKEVKEPEEIAKLWVEKNGEGTDK